MIRNPVFLYVEDEPFSRTVMEMLLVRALGYKNLTILSSSDQFLERIGELPQPPNVIFLDIHMEPHDGFTMLSMLRARSDYQNVRVIAVTASVMNEEVQMLKRAGFDGAIAKPIDQIAFPQLVRNILDGEEVWNIV